MIQQAVATVEPQWQKELKQSFTRPEELLRFLNIEPQGLEADFAARDLFAMRVPRPFANLMTKGDLNDPLLKQVLPLKEEFKQVPGYVADPLAEHKSALPGLLHKYKSRVLVVFRGGCAVNCRYCFRRHFPYQDNNVNKAQLLEHIQYLRDHAEVNEVILSGGDPLMAKDEHVAWFINELEAIPHILRLRIHSRLPVVIPSRLTSNLIDTLASSRLKAVLVLHINHANEISDELAKACRSVREKGIWLLNQAVLLSGINHELEDQINLSEALFAADIQPYYLHLLDKVAGASHFDLPETDALGLYQAMMAALPGFLLPRLVREIGGEASKTPVLP